MQIAHLRRHLVRPIPYHGNHAAALGLGGDGVAQDGADGPADAAVLHLEFVSAAVGQLHALALEPRVACFVGVVAVISGRRH